VRGRVDAPAVEDAAFVFAILDALFRAIMRYLPMLYLPLFTEMGIAGFGNPNLAFYLVLRTFSAGLAATTIVSLDKFALALSASTILLCGRVVVRSTAEVAVWSAIWSLTSSAIIAMSGAFLPLFSPSLGASERARGCIGLDW
jgi:hypothetical protein